MRRATVTCVAIDLISRDPPQACGVGVLAMEAGEPGRTSVALRFGRAADRWYMYSTTDAARML